MARQRYPKGSSKGGQYMPKIGASTAARQAMLREMGSPRYAGRMRQSFAKTMAKALKRK